MQAVLRIVGATVLAGLVGLAVGLGAGWVTLGRGATVADEVPVAAAPLAPDVALPAAPTPAAAVDVGKLLAEQPKDKGAVKPVTPSPQEHTPDVIEETPLVGDPSLLPRGPGRTAILDLEAAGLPTLQVRLGVLNRDGAALWARFAKNPKVATLQGPQARVELLHLGFDAEARPVLAHIRTVDDARVEGVISLVTTDSRIPVLADPDPPDLTPPPVKPPAEDDAPQE